MTEINMKKIATLALAISLSASTAFAGGYTAPVVDATPVAAGTSSSNAGILIPALLLVGIAVAASSN